MMPQAGILSAIFSRIPGNKDIRIFIFTGGAGMGKSEIALNFACLFKNDGPVTFLDLDPIKPCFRSRDAKDDLEKFGIRLVMTPVSSLDIPAISPENAGLLSTPQKGRLVIDLAGQETGIRMLGGYYRHLSDAALFWVINYSRPFTGNDDELISWKKNAEAASRLKFTGIVHNTHLMQKTTPELIFQSAERARKLAEKINLPLIFHGIAKNILEKETIKLPEPILPLKIFLTPPWEKFPRPQV